MGTNDLKYTNAAGAAEGVRSLIRFMQNADETIPVSQPIFPNGVHILLVSPPHIAEEIDVLRPESTLAGKARESHHFASLYRQTAQSRNVYFLDAARYASPSLADCIHIDQESHTKLGTTIANKITEIFSGK